MTTSVAFWSAKASQLRSCAESWTSSSTSCGTCCGGGGGADGQPGDGLLQLGDLRRGGGEIVAPDVVAVHDAGDEGLVAQGGEGRGGGNLALEDVQVQGVDAGRGEGAELAVERAVRGGDEQLRAVGRGGEHLVGAGDGGLDLRGRGVLVHHEGGLVELDPAGAGGGQLLQQCGVDGQHVLEAGQRAEAGRGVVGGLAQQQEGDRADDVRAGLHAVGEGVLEFLDDAGWRSARSWSPGRFPGRGSGSWCRTTWSFPAAAGPCCRGPG